MDKMTPTKPTPPTHPATHAKAPQTAAEKKATFDAQQIPVIHPTAEELQPVFDLQAKAVKEYRLKSLAYEFPEVAELLEERNANKTKSGKQVKG